MKQKYHIALIEHEDGVSVSCPDLPGCHSQGATVDEAMENIRDAVREYLEIYGAPKTRVEFREMEVASV